MAKMAVVDYIVVGQGISGSCLACELMRRGKKIAIFDGGWMGAACLVAAGVINPITGKRLVKSWRSADAHPYAKLFYGGLEAALGERFFRQRKILQLCRSEQERELWLSRLSQAEYSGYIEESLPAGHFEGLNDACGSYVVGKSAWVEAPALMGAFRKFFKAERVLVEEEFCAQNLDRSGNFLRYADIEAGAVVFCEGWRALENPFFSWLPWRPAKGEILEIEAGAHLPEYVVHRGNWIMKFGRGRFRIGSTWDRENLNDKPTERGRDSLLGVIPNILPGCSDFRVVGHSAGVRPCTATTRPHLGRHPQDGRLLCFNGFGSKGYALSPYFARHFADFLEGKTELDKEADLSRHVGKFFRPKFGAL